tara:strand:- start:7551 stop:8894 length:1344 start_codon:yes stop_codon:yes gene_type:complete
MTPSPTLLKYARQNTPRYTSYPTAPHFHAGIDGEVFADWLGAMDADAAGSLYLHIPWCREMCWYCGCSTRATTRDEPVATYAGTLLKEIDLIAGRFAGRPRIAHIHFGGGTPTILTEGQLSAIMASLRQRFDVADTAEIAIEIDPRIFTASMADHLASLGFNRASLGVQTFDAAVQAKINRIQPVETVAACADALRAAGITNLSFDLLYGLPGQTLEACLETVTAALALEPDRFSVFGYAHVPHMKKHQKLIQDEDLPNAEARIEQALAIADALQAAGYRPIGIDHYARAGDEMAQQAKAGTMRRNFQGYTTDQATFLIGLGASAISQTPEGYAQNTADVASWSRAIEAGHLATARGVALGGEDRIRGEIIERLMCDLEVDPGAVAAKFGGSIDRPDLDDLLRDGIIRWQGRRIIIADEYRTLARVVAARFDGYLQANAGARHSVSV